MSASHVTVKLNRSLVEEARHQAATFSRSVSAQLEHWMRLGRDVESNDVLTHGQTRALLTPPEARDAREAAEAEAARDAAIAFFTNLPQSVHDHYRELGSRPGAIGDDENGVLVRIGEDGKPHPI